MYYVTVRGCVNYGSVEATTTSSWTSCAGVVGFCGNQIELTVENAYSTVSGNGGHNGLSCTADQLDDKVFYTDTLGWSEDVWDLSHLDVANGYGPMLK